ncbi:hypothetical protein CC1G_09024 [Coprinopsis cinerea okayama7|uniref:Uncharacterized protein n=1 Tax=Coprinopsis cinerea (strain Okayama-7 / 130 / ATCC MYA-4618 / FGSC 9003) TaxID=240176 RepID=A8N9I9_COPC7|nr:hypothetical protein CC1G_09024 [Coprinopsis cinerea okayama7\|eukprot:XP_001831495.1 hypothetical protein CC1G_09024 [Coprinopsis cinerea okayama7\
MAPPSVDAIDVQEGYPSTDLIRILLANLKNDTKGYSRYTKSSTAILVKSNETYDGIIDLIKQVHGFETIDASSWEAFERSADGITALEDFLLSLLLEGHDKPAVPEGANIAELITFAETWVAQRAKVVEAADRLEKIASKSRLVKETATFKKAILQAQKEDDVDTISAVVTQISANTFSDDDLVLEESEKNDEKYVTFVKESIADFSAKVTSLPESCTEAVIGKVVSGVMLLSVPFLVAQMDNVNAKTDAHVKSSKIWKAAKDFAEYLKESLDSSKLDEDPLKEKWEAFKKLLLDIVAPGPLTAQLLTLMRLVAQVRRPFYGRSVALVKMWHAINTEKLQNVDDKKERGAVIKSLKATKAALSKAAKEITSFDEGLTQQAQSVGVEYDGLLDDVTALVAKYASDKTDTKAVYQTAKEVDEGHLKRFREKVKKVAP